MFFRRKDRNKGETMYLISDGAGSMRRTSTGLSSTTKLLWVSAAKDAEGKPLASRRPEESYTRFPDGKSFTAAGRRYSTKGVELTKTGDGLYRDKYGREVLYLAERFPCFDVYDLINEDRWERWFLIYTGGSLTCVKFTDGKDYVEVWEDAAELDYAPWRRLEKLRWHMPPEEE